MPKSAVTAAIAEIADTAESALQKAEASLPKDFPPALHASVSKAVKERIGLLAGAPEARR